MDDLNELSRQISIRLENLLKDFDDRNRKRKAFIDDTRQFFEQRLSIYEQQRKEFEGQIEKLSEQMFKLVDELQLPRTKYEHHQMALNEQLQFINENISQLKTMIFERDKELIQLRELIDIKLKLIGNIQIDTNNIRSVNEGKSIRTDLQNQFNKLKEDIHNLTIQICSLKPDFDLNKKKPIKSFLSINDENELNWLNEHQPLNGFTIQLNLIHDYEKLRKIILDEVIRLRQELNQKEPPSPYDLQQELSDLRLRKRYLELLSSYPHKLTANSSLDEIRRTYEQFTAALRAKAREKLIDLWDQLDLPDNQRIIPKTKDNEEDYLAMNDEINRLETYVESIRPILVKIQKREWYKKEMVEFEKRAGDPARLRGNSTQLLKEEKFRKDLSREFPKLTDDLRRLVAEWEESSGKKLIYGGEPYMETMNKEKLSVDFELLHLRLLTKCQILVQQTKDDAVSISSGSQTPPLALTPPSTPKTTSRLPTMTFTNSHRKVQKQT